MTWRRRSALLSVLVVIGISLLAYWKYWPYIVFQNPELYFLIESQRDLIARISDEKACDISKVTNELGMLAKRKSKNLFDYIETSVRISREENSGECLIEVPSGLDSFIYKVTEACWITGIGFPLPIDGCRKK